MIINSNTKEKNKEIINDEKEKNITERKNVVEQYKNLLKQIKFFSFSKILSFSNSGTKKTKNNQKII